MRSAKDDKGARQGRGRDAELRTQGDVLFWYSMHRYN